MKRVFLILFAGLLCLSIPLLVVLGVKRARQPRQVFDSAAYQNRILVLDAGHGGEDGGAVSAAALLAGEAASTLTWKGRFRPGNRVPLARASI